MAYLTKLFRNNRNHLSLLQTIAIVAAIPKQNLVMNIVKDTKTLGAVVRQTRKTDSIRIDDAASFAGVSADLMSRLENGTSSVRLDKVLQVLESLGLALVVMTKDEALDLS